MSNRDATFAAITPETIAAICRTIVEAIHPVMGITLGIDK